MSTNVISGLQTTQSIREESVSAVDNFWRRFDRLMTPPDRSRLKTVDDVPVVPSLYEFIQAARRVYPRMQILANYESACSIGFSRVYVYMPNDPFIMGAIAFEPVGKESRYAVYSRLISNGKYKTRSSEFRRFSSADLNNAMREFKKYVRPVTIEEITYNVMAPSVHESTGAYHKTIRERQSAVYKLKEVASLVDEIVQMRMAGHTFRNAEINIQADALIAHNKEVGEVKQLPQVATLLVVVREKSHGRGVMFNYALTDLRHPAAVTTVSNVVKKDAWYSEEETPVEVLNSISTLMMMDQGKYVIGVGMKHLDGLYNVEVSVDTYKKIMEAQ